MSLLFNMIREGYSQIPVYGSEFVGNQVDHVAELVDTLVSAHDITWTQQRTSVAQ